MVEPMLSQLGLDDEKFMIIIIDPFPCCEHKLQTEADGSVMMSLYKFQCWLEANSFLTVYGFEGRHDVNCVAAFVSSNQKLNRMIKIVVG
jgi:hypothetical protein